MDRQTDVDFKMETCLSFFIHTNTVLEIIGLVKYQRDKMKDTEGDTEKRDNDSFSHHSVGNSDTLMKL